MLVIDAANVIGSKPNGWWRDRPGSARRFVEKLREAGKQGRIPLPAVVVLEGAARPGAAEADVDGVRVVHAAHHGDDALVAETAAATSSVVFVSADRRLLERVRDLGAETVGPVGSTSASGPMALSSTAETVPTALARAGTLGHRFHRPQVEEHGERELAFVADARAFRPWLSE